MARAECTRTSRASSEATLRMALLAGSRPIGSEIHRVSTDVRGTGLQGRPRPLPSFSTNQIPFPPFRPRPRGSPFSPSIRSDPRISRRGPPLPVPPIPRTNISSCGRGPFHHVRIHPSAREYGLLPSPSHVHASVRQPRLRLSSLPILRDACQVCRAQRRRSENGTADAKGEEPLGPGTGAGDAVDDRARANQGRKNTPR